MIRFLFPFLVLTSSVVAGQSLQQKVLYIDHWFSVELPEGYTQLDTAGQSIYTADGDYGGLSVVKVPQPGVRTWTKEDILAFYRNFRDSYPSGGVHISDTSYVMDDLLVSRFSYQNNPEGNAQTGEVLVILVEDKAYVFGYAYVELDHETAQERDHFFSSIKHAPSLIGENQFTDSNEHIAQGQRVGVFFRYVLIALVVIAIVLWWFKKNNSVRIIKNLVAVSFLFFGFANFVFYIINLLFTEKRESMLPMFIFLLIGSLLYKIRIPTRGKSG